MRELFYVLIGLGGLLLVLAFPPSRDTTDPPEGRSGLVLFTDAETGCQYLSGGRRSGVTPRVDGAGRHVGCKR